MVRQSTDTIVVVRPDDFGFNPQTAETNPYQHEEAEVQKDPEEVRSLALKEFETLAQTLRNHGVKVLVLPSKTDVVTPDAVFPNNWFSHHEDGKLVLYPMLTSNRRQERQKDALVKLLNENGIAVSGTIDLTKDEEDGLILESTGSMVLDRINKVAFAMASPRTSEAAFKQWCKTMGYEGVYITTPKSHVDEVYHTNLVMSIGTSFAVVCFDVIEDDQVKQQVRDLIEDLGKECIEISLDQVYAFCGNILEVQSSDGQKKIVMSETALDAYTEGQLRILGKFGEIVPMAIPTIEHVGGGGVRCMMAEVFD
jgi:hypothetical protein